jgi:broad specificity phosphatase PhoE/ketosteroid isomerase-like protein
MRLPLLGTFFALFFAPALTAQGELPPPVVFEAEAGEAAPPLPCHVQAPAGHEATTWAPLVVVFAPPNADAADLAAAAAEHAPGLVGLGFVVAFVPAIAASDARLSAACDELRRRWRSEQGGWFAAIGLDAASAEAAAAAVLRHRHQFQVVGILGAAGPGLPTLRRVPQMRVLELATAEALPAALHAARQHRVQPDAAGEVTRLLDEFHDAAARADGPRYFALLPEDAVFLGTDPDERWTAAAFRRFAEPYFARGRGWLYVARQRQVELAEGGRVAWFDEVLDNAHYGACRGSGVAERRAGGWVIRQYNLTILVPNDAANAVAARIRAWHDGLPAEGARIVLVRHAERQDESRDADLSDAGRTRAERLAHVLTDVPVTTVHATEFRRTQATVGPLCAARGLDPTISPAADVPQLVARLRATQPGESIVVCGHSNTVSEIARQLGAEGVPDLEHADYDRLFVVTLSAAGASLQILRY